MAQIAFDAIPESASRGEGQFNNVDFFNLRDDGDEAIVRIMHASTEQFNIFAVHDRISVGGKFRKVNCLRGPHDATEMCPLCASGNNVSYKIFINMIQYVLDPQTGKIAGKPVVWERGINYAQRLKGLINEYGPLSDCIMKIKRNGKAGSMDTTYDIFYCPPRSYPDENYPKDTEAFKDYSALGTIILNKDYTELSTFLATGSFPATQQQQQAASNEPVVTAPPAMSYQPKTANPAPAPQYPPVATTPAEVPASQPPVLDAPPFNPPYTTAAPTTTPGKPTARYY